MRGLRWVMCGAVALSLCEQAVAGDLGMPVLRGSNAYDLMPMTRWNGAYFGVQAGANIGSVDFGNATKSLVAFILRNTTIENEQHPSDWTTLGKGDTNGVLYGGFVGYNTQWDDAVVGIELNYNRTSLSLSAMDSMARQFTTSDNFSNTVTVRGMASTHITDYGTARLRGGWAAGSFMPYAMVGLAVGRADVVRTATVVASGFDTTGVNPPYNLNLTKTDASLGAFAYGYAAGLGVDWAVLPNVFVRGEYEYVQFGAFNDLKVHISSVRGAVGVKF